MRTWLEKGRRFVESAELLLQAGDTDGCVNRAYYAMHWAARSALHRIDPGLAVAKTHATIIRRFGEHLVIGHGLEARLGRAFNRAELLRRLADYESPPTDDEEARELVERAREFIAAVERVLSDAPT